MLFALAGLGALTAVAYVLLPESRRDWCLAVPIIGIGAAVVLAALFVLVMIAWIGWTIHPILGVLAGGFVVLFEVQLTRLILRECL